ncbi:MAG TPA: GldG family protein [Opitutus sp.]|nr:GldG family protein [Opitutus sp.]
MPFSDSFRAARWVRTLNLVLQALLFLTLFGGLNYLARNYAQRFDLTQQRRYSLSPETEAYLKNLTRPVRIVVTLTEDPDRPEIAQAYRDMRGLLREYVYLSEGNESRRITVDFLDVYQHRREADQLGITDADSIVLICGDKRRTVARTELYRIEGRDARVAFQGEQVITSAILDVSSPEKKKIYFLTGHAELSPDDVDPVRGLSLLRDALRQRNFETDTLNLAYTRRIPADASVVVAVAPQGQFQPLEQELLRQYLMTSAGRLILLLAPGYPHGLEELLLEWGVVVDDDVIIDTGPQTMTEDGELLLRALTPHAITRTLLDYRLFPRIGPARSVRADPIRSRGKGLSVTTLAATSASAWGEVSYRNPTAHEFNPGVDVRPQSSAEAEGLGVVLASERVPVRDNLPFSVRTGRLVVFGTGDLIANDRIADVANQNIFLGAVNWAVDRDSQFNIPARPIETFQLSLSAGELSRLRYTLLLALPAAAALLGLIVYWTRRS